MADIKIRNNEIQILFIHLKTRGSSLITKKKKRDMMCNIMKERNERELRNKGERERERERETIKKTSR
jgi:hypothetical protein